MNPESDVIHRRALTNSPGVATARERGAQLSEEAGGVGEVGRAGVNDDPPPAPQILVASFVVFLLPRVNRVPVVFDGNPQ